MQGAEPEAVVDQVGILLADQGLEPEGVLGEGEELDLAMGLVQDDRGRRLVDLARRFQRGLDAARDRGPDLDVDDEEVLGELLAARDEARLDRVSQTIHEAHGVRVVPVACDVSLAEAAAQIVGAAEAEFGGADILINMTNDAWFGDTTEPWQHLALAKFRAVEHRRFRRQGRRRRRWSSPDRGRPWPGASGR